MPNGPRACTPEAAGYSVPDCENERGNLTPLWGHPRNVLMSWIASTGDERADIYLTPFRHAHDRGTTGRARRLFGLP